MTAQPAIDAPETRIALIQGSLRCLTLGLLSFIPFVGLGTAIAAFARVPGLLRLGETTWNPAYRYLVVGVCCAVLGGLVSLAAWAILIIGIYQVWSGPILPAW